MALHITFRPGGHQAVNAGRYFQEEANTLVNTILASSIPRNYFVDPGNGPSIPFRFWSATLLGDKDLTALALLVDRMEDEVQQLADRPEEELLGKMFRKWSGIPWPAQVFFLERLSGEGPFGPNEEVRGSFAVMNGTLALLSAPRFILFQLDPELHGVAIADKGSFLLDHHEGEEHLHVHEHPH